MSYWIVHLLNGISFGMVLFLMAAGLSLIFGLMRIVNLTHGALYLLGTYVALSINRFTNWFPLAVITGTVAIGILGILFQRFFLQRFQHEVRNQLLLTIGFVFIFADLALYIWGGEPRLLPKPVPFRESLWIGGLSFPSYRLLIIFIGVIVAIALWLLLERTKVGALIRAGVDDAEMARGLGIKVPVLFTGVFGLGASISAFGGAIASPIIGAYPGLEWEILLMALAVLLIGGLGSLKGAFVGSLFVGLADNFGKVLIPELALFIIFGSVAVVLAFKPTGLFGKSY
jgi:branched-chain amino acid transport system permease protein